MFKKIISLIIVLLLINTFFVQAISFPTETVPIDSTISTEQQPQPQSQGYRELEFKDNKATLDKPATINGVIIFPGDAPATITKNEYGSYDINGEVVIHGVSFKNVKNSQFNNNLVNGIAGDNSKVGEYQLTKNTIFLYDQNTGKITILKGGSVYVGNQDGRIQVTSKKGDMKFPAKGFSGAERFIELSPWSSAEVSYRPNVNLLYNAPSYYVVSSLSDDTKISGLGTNTIKVEGSAVLIPAKIELKPEIGPIVPSNEFVQVTKGTAEVTINPQTGTLVSAVFSKGSEGYYRSYKSAVLGEYGLNTLIPTYLTYSNEKAAGGIFFDKSPSWSQREDLEGFVVMKTIGKSEQFPMIIATAKGLASVSAVTPYGQSFEYSGKDLTSADMKIQNAKMDISITHPSLGNPSENIKEIAEVNYGGVQSFFGIQNGKPRQLVETASVFTDKPSSVMDLRIGAPNGLASTDSERGGLFGFNYNDKGPEGMAFISGQFDLAEQEDLSKVRGEISKIIESEKNSRLSGSLYTAAFTALAATLEVAAINPQAIASLVGLRILGIGGLAIGAIIGGGVYAIRSIAGGSGLKRIEELNAREKAAAEQRDRFQKIENDLKGK